MNRKPKFSLLEWILLGFILVASIVGILLVTGDPVYWWQENRPGSSYREFDNMILTVAEKHQVDPALVKAVIWQESRFEPGATGSSGERGLMQVTEIAARDWVAANKAETFVPTDLFDPKTNLEVGVWYLSRALQRFADRDSSIPFALAEYNAGLSRVQRWLGAEEETKIGSPEFLERIDFPMTFNYIDNIVARHAFYQRRGEFGD